ncbi:uncharacterized protein [Linepithema humile]|uniref:uncharacterized protein n=1 Tax=Linepithema humile TaxID=83485 RepID=UPI00351F4356
MNMKRNCSAEYANDELDLLLEVNVEEDVSSRRSLNKFYVSSDMAHGDVWKITIAPPQITSSNYTITPSTRTLSTISEYESKRDLCDPFDEKEKTENTYQNVKRSEIVSSSPTYQKLNHDYSGHSCSLDKRLIPALCEDRKELDDRTDEKISKEDTLSKICGDTSNALFIELGAACKVLEFITDSDSNVSSVTNSRCNEISRTLRRVLTQRRSKKLEDFLSKDSSLYKCERCGVISMLRSRFATERVKENRTKTKHDIVSAERDCTNNEQNNEEPEISISDVENNVQSRIFVNGSEMNRRTKYKNESHGTESLPINERAYVIKSCIESSKRVNNVSERKTDVKIKNKSHFNNNVLKRLFIDFKNNKEYNSTSQNNYSCNYEPSTVMKAYADKEEIVRKISYEPKLQIDDSLAGDWRTKSVQKIQGLQRLFEKRKDMYSTIDTVKYLARGQFTSLDKEEDLFSKMQEGRCIRVEDARKRQSSILYGSRDDYPQRDSGFWLFDESGHLSEIDEYLPMLKVNNNRKNIMRHSDTREKKKKIVDSWSDCTEKDSLEDCTVLGRRRESNTTFSSSSAENLIHEWMGSLDKKDEINNTDGDTPRGRRLVSSRPSLDIARHVRAEIARDRISDNAQKSMREPRTHESNFLARLSPETRRKFYHVIQKMLSLNSAEDLMFYCERCLTTDVLNGKKLLHSKSTDGTFVRCNKLFTVDKERTNICADDYIPTKLSAEDKNCRRRDNSVNTRSRDSDVSKDSVKISHENMTTPASFDKSRQGKMESADNFARKIARRIIYRDESLKDVVGDEHTTAEILRIYREILANSGDMDWDSFRALVDILHPGQRELWRDVCRAISEEAEGVDGNTEVCIEISPVTNPEDAPKTGGIMACTREMVFELDMTLKDVEGFLNKRPRPTQERLDIHKNAGEAITDWDRGGREAISKQAR